MHWVGDEVQRIKRKLKAFLVVGPSRRQYAGQVLDPESIEVLPRHNVHAIDGFKMLIAVTYVHVTSLLYNVDWEHVIFKIIVIAVSLVIRRIWSGWVELCAISWTLSTFLIG